jgi:hypothetical protein
MSTSNKTKQKKMLWSTAFRRPGFILPKREHSASKQDASHTKKGASKVKNSSTIPSKNKVSPSDVGTESADTSSTHEIPHSVIHETTSRRKQETQTNEASIATDDHASAVRATAVSTPSIVHHDAHPPFTDVQPTFGSEHAASRRGKAYSSEYTVSENDGSSFRSFRSATPLQEQTNHGLDRKAPVFRHRQHVNCEGDVLPSSEQSATSNGNGNTKAAVKSLVTAKNRPQDRPGAHSCPPFPTFYHDGKRVTLIDPI